MIFILKIIESMFSKYPSFDYEFSDFVLDLVFIGLAKFVIQIIIWM
jgi:hypothetical protein